VVVVVDVVVGGACRWRGQVLYQHSPGPPIPPTTRAPAAVFDVFTCRPTVPADYDASGAEIRYMAGVFERCGVPGGTQLRLLPWAIVALAVYVVGYPAGLALLLWRNRELIMEDQLLRAKGAGDDRLTNPHAYLFRRMFSRVYYQFRPAVIGWVLASEWVGEVAAVAAEQ
jgi:hypothetical protein